MDNEEATQAQIAPLQHYMEAEPCSASTLTLTRNYTRNSQQTELRLVCDACFPEEFIRV
jgi:hypothetical protein